MANSVDPDQTATLFASILKLGNYLQQTTTADDISDASFHGALRVNTVLL